MTNTPNTKAQKTAPKRDDEPDEAAASTAQDGEQEAPALEPSGVEDPDGWDTRTHGEPPSERPATDF